MTKEVKEKQVAAPMYTQEEVDFREDLLQKLMTCDHVKGVLIAREDSPIFITQISDMKQIFLKWYQDALAGKRIETAGDGDGKTDEEPGSGED